MPVTPLEKYDERHSRHEHQDMTIRREMAITERKQNIENELTDIISGEDLKRNHKKREYIPLREPLDTYSQHLRSQPSVGSTRYIKTATPDFYSRESVSATADSLNYSKFPTSKYPFYKPQKDINTIIRPHSVAEIRQPNKNKTGTYEGLLRQWTTTKEHHEDGSFYMKKGKILNIPTVIQRATAGEAMRDRYVVIDPIKRGRYNNIDHVTKSQFGVSVPKTWRSQETARHVQTANRKFYDTESLEMHTSSNRGIYSQRTKSFDIDGRRPYAQYQSTWWRNLRSNRKRIDIPIVHREHVPWYYKNKSTPIETQTLRWGRRKQERFDNLAYLNKNSQLGGTSLRHVYKVPFTGEHFKGGTELKHTYRGKDLQVRQRAMRNVQYNNERRFDAAQPGLSYEKVASARRHHINDNNHHFQNAHIHRAESMKGGTAFGLSSVSLPTRRGLVHSITSTLRTVPTRTYNLNKGLQRGLSSIVSSISALLPKNVPVNHVADSI